MTVDDRTVLVSGATGQQGGAVARNLLESGWSVRAMTRKPDGEPARQLRELGADVVQADLNDEASLRHALAGVWGAFGVQNTWEAGIEGEEEQGKRFARVAKEVGVRHLVYHSVGSANRHTGIPHFENKWRIEETIRSLRLPSYVIIRPAAFMENWLLPQTLQGIANGVFPLALEPETKLQQIAVRDIGLYGCRAFERADALNGREIDIAGDELTGPEMAGILSEVIGREIRYQQVPIEQIRAFSEDTALMFEWMDRVGYNADIAARSAELGVEPTNFRAWASAQSWC